MSDIEKLTERTATAFTEIRNAIEDLTTAHRLAGVYSDSRYSSQSARADRIETDIAGIRDQLAAIRAEIRGLARAQGIATVSNAVGADSAETGSRDS